MKGTGKLYGLRVDSWVDERRDPVRATDAAARHLADLRDRFGSMYLAAAAYNAGAGKVGPRAAPSWADDEDEEEDNPDATFFRLYDTRFLRRETKDYVPKLIAAALIAKQPEKYGFERPVGIEPHGLRFDHRAGCDRARRPRPAGRHQRSRRCASSTRTSSAWSRPRASRRSSGFPREPRSLVTARYAALEPEEPGELRRTCDRARGQTLAGDRAELPGVDRG